MSVPVSVVKLPKSENGNVSDDQLSTYFRKLYLSDDEIDELVDFLENGLRDPNLERYVPEDYD